MKAFYSLSEQRKKYFELYKISSIEAYINSISKLEVNLEAIKSDKIHKDYEFIQEFIEKQIQKANRIVFFGVYDLSKEAYILNKYKKKKFLLCDVSIDFLKRIENKFGNINILETSIQNFVPNREDLVITNLSEYFLNKKEFIRFISLGGNIILNNVNIIERRPFYQFYNLIQSFKIHLVNLLSVFIDIKQYQFRGWIRTLEEYNRYGKMASKKISFYSFNSKREIKYRFLKMKSAIIFYTKEQK